MLTWHCCIFQSISVPIDTYTPIIHIYIYIEMFRQNQKNKYINISIYIYVCISFISMFPLCRSM